MVTYNLLMYVSYRLRYYETILVVNIKGVDCILKFNS